jgi:hypothetical protein
MQGKEPVLVRTNGHAYHFDSRSGKVRKLLPTQAVQVQESFADLTAFIKKEEEDHDPIMRPEWTSGDTDVVVTRVRTAEGDMNYDESEANEAPSHGRRNLSRKAKTKGVEKLRMST